MVLWRQCGMGATISDVRQGSIADEAGISRGDQLIEINGHGLTDLLVYRFYAAEPLVTLRVQKPCGEELIYEIEKDEDDDLGLEFSHDLFDETHRCHNRCQFCFVDQMPRGMRSTLYVKDDDYRLSFLYGNYITLTNLQEADWDSIRRLHLSPLYVSVHATNPKIRQQLMTNPAAGAIKKHLQRLADWGIAFHCQIVLCPGINDGSCLKRTVEDLAALWPQARSTAIVPVGLTRFREGLPLLQSVTPDQAADVISEAHEWQQHFLKEKGTRFVWLSDEFHLLAGSPLPSFDSYEDFSQLENGVGLSVLFFRDFELAIEDAPSSMPKRRHLSIATGVLGEKVLREPVERLRQIRNLDIRVYVVPNAFFGPEITVSGLITGADLINVLAGQPLGEALLIPAACLKDGSRFLDDYLVSEVAEELQVPVIPVEGARELVERVTEPWGNQ